MNFPHMKSNPFCGKQFEYAEIETETDSVSNVLNIKKVSKH